MRHSKPVRLGYRIYRSPAWPVLFPTSRLVGTISNSADAVRLETAPTGGESVHLFKNHQCFWIWHPSEAKNET